MKIIVPFKTVADTQDIAVAADGTLNYGQSQQVVSSYDLNAFEAAAQLAAANSGSSVVAISVATAKADDSKLKKGILARGIDELVMTADDAYKGIDARATAAALVGLLGEVGDYDVIICGDGSADIYAQQVGVQLASALDLPSVTSVVKIEASGDKLICDRMLETSIETVEVTLPAVLSVAPDIALPRISGMKDILAAGKKPSKVVPAGSVESAVIEVVEEKAPEQVARKQEIFTSSDDDIAKFVAAIKASL